MRKYLVDIHLKTGFIVPMEAEEENGELALNKIQGMFYLQDGWIHLTDRNGDKHRILGNNVNNLFLFDPNKP